MVNKAKLLIVVPIILSILISRATYNTAAQKTDDCVSKIFRPMTTKEKIGQLFMVSWSGKEPGASLETLITEYHVGSVYISGINFKNTEAPTAAEQVAELTNELQEIAASTTEDDGYFLPLFLAVDHEGDGARYTRIRSGMTAIPSPLAIGATWSPENAQNIGEIVGSELSSIGINMLLGPVLDVVDDPMTGGKGNLDTRVFGGDPYWVGELGRAYIRGVHIGSDNKIVTVAKHFPGHGDSDRATDRAVPETGKKREELLEVDLVPFIRVAEQVDGDDLGKTDAMMSSHIGIDETNDYPISLYYDDNEQNGGITKLIQEIETLNSWHSNGFVVVDNLGVGALKPIFTDEEQMAQEALLAGNDLLIVHNFIKNPIEKFDPDIHKKMMEVMDEFENLYETDKRVEDRIDEAVCKIVRAKLLLYPDLSLNSVQVDPSLIPANKDKQEKEDAISNIAKESIALIKPDMLPQGLKLEKGDRIVFIVHNVGIKDWRLLGLNNFTDFLVEHRDFDESMLTNRDYYQEIYEEPPGEPGFSQFVYWHYLNSKEDRDKLSEDEEEAAAEEDKIEREINEADWIIFAFLTGDCGPDAYRSQVDDFKTDADRCLRGSAEADTLKKFLPYYNGDAKIVAISFGGPPWTLGTSDVSDLDIYLGAFNQLKPFQDQALLTLLREITPTGASPIDVEGANYLLEKKLQPDDEQEVSINIENPPDNGWVVGDTIELKTSEVVDQNGNPIVSDIRVSWRGDNIDLATPIQPISVSPVLTFGKAQAEFELSEVGEIVFTAEVDGLLSNALHIEVMPNESDSVPPHFEELGTPIVTEQVVVEQITPGPPTATDTVVPSPTPEPTLTPSATRDGGNDDDDTNVDRTIAIIAVVVTLIGIIGSIFLAPIFEEWWRNRGTKTESPNAITSMRADKTVDEIADTDDEG